ncbi:MAG: hypothetical protein WBM03_14015 [Steroidobacteraceae bacterium]
MTRSDECARLTPVLMLVPYFAPQTHAAMFRAHKLAKYLPEFGYRPIVVTTDINYLYNEDDSLLAELPACVEVHRARHVEPTLRGVRMMLGGRDRTFNALKRAGKLMPGPQGAALQQGSPGSRMAISSPALVRIFGEWPDRYWTWSLAAQGMCRRLIRQHGIRLLYTTAVPVSPLRAARRLQREFGLRWVADFRDPAGYGQKHTAQGLMNAALERSTLKATMRHADMVTGLGSAYGGIFFDLFGLPESRYRFIPTGMDEAYLDSLRKPDEPSLGLLHVGEIMPNQSAHAFAVLARAHELCPEAMSKFRLEFIGRRELNQPRVDALTSSLPQWPFKIVFTDHLPQRELYARIAAAKACLLIPGRQRYWWNNFAKMVDYIALGKLVIADVPPVSEARNELTRAGTAFFLDGEDVDSDARALLIWLASDQAGVDGSYRDRYTARRQVADFVDVFDGLLQGGGVQ